MYCIIESRDSNKKVAVITGGTSGLGLQIVKDLQNTYKHTKYKK